MLIVSRGVLIPRDRVIDGQDSTLDAMVSRRSIPLSEYACVLMLSLHTGACPSQREDASPAADTT